MSFYSIQSFGDTFEKALVFCKINEIGYKTKFKKNSILRKTRVYKIDLHENFSCNPEKLITELFIYYNSKNLNRDKTHMEINIINKLNNFYGEQTMNEIMNIYENAFEKKYLKFALQIYKTKPTLLKFVY